MIIFNIFKNKLMYPRSVILGDHFYHTEIYRSKIKQKKRKIETKLQCPSLFRLFHHPEFMSMVNMRKKQKKSSEQSSLTMIKSVGVL
jgi:hypothetical protein